MDPDYLVRPAQRADLDRLVTLQLALQDHLEAANPDLWHMSDEARAQLKGQIAARLAASDSKASRPRSIPPVPTVGSGSGAGRPQGVDSCVLVAEHVEDGVIGVIYGRVIINKSYVPCRAGVVDQAFVQQQHRRRDVGARLVAGLCAFFAGQGIEDLSLRYVVGNKEATAFWTALGFTPRIITLGASRQAVEKELKQTTSNPSP
jgi:GNAT superfamily N-acetyltransferase